MISTERPSPARRRARRNVAICAIVVVLFGAGYASVRSDDWIFRASMATAYSSLALLAAGLVIGPLNVLRQRPNPVSTHLRRDLGIWAGVLGLAHVVVGLQVHLRGRMLEYFIDPRHRLPIPVRVDAFGLTNWAGLAATLILVLLLFLSNDWSLARLGSARWKKLQRTSYVMMALVAAHGAVYQLVEKRQWPFVVTFTAILVAVLVLQGAGFRKVARER